MNEDYYVIYFEGGQDMPYCRIAYDTDDTGYNRNLVLNGYSIMAHWWDATLFKTKEEAINIILNNKDTKHIQKDKLKVLHIKINKDTVYEAN